MSKIPPQLRQSVLALLETATAFTFRHVPGSARALEDFLAGCQHFVQCFLKVSRAFSKLLSHLGNILFEALFDLLSKQLLERPVAQTLGVLRGMVGDDVRDERSGKTLGALVWIL